VIHARLLCLFFSCLSARFVFGAGGGCGAAAGVDHGVDELEDGALIGGRELFDALEALQEARRLG
jgi:hypothetical protein